MAKKEKVLTPEQLIKRMTKYGIGPKDERLIPAAQLKVAMENIWSQKGCAGSGSYLSWSVKHSACESDIVLSIFRKKPVPLHRNSLFSSIRYRK